MTGSNMFGNGEDVGAMKGELCFIPVGTRRLQSLGNYCRPEGVFYTRELNIQAHEFSAGFPGITHRSVWFMINYQGRFRVFTTGE